ncbi:hypothetical protein DFR95_003897 [Clostridium beijerinckii]|nr:hypothetical protein [Clostridium beijerinckii]NRZ89050.1 hypothetical protein [Clostridium beijerinckii]
MYNIEVTKSEIIGTYLLLIIPFFLVSGLISNMFLALKV